MATLQPFDPKIPYCLYWKIQSPSQSMSKAQKTGSILRVDFALLTSPHLHRAYLVTVCNRSFIAIITQSALQIPLRQLPFENGSLQMGSTPLESCIGLFLKNFFSNFRSYIKDSKWGRKCTFIDCISCNGSPQQIPFQFVNGILHHSRCRAF